MQLSNEQSSIEKLNIDAEIKEKAVRIIRAIEKRNIHCVDVGYAQRENQSKLN